jgi:hypothetical protein
MEPYENIVKERTHKSMMSKNKDADSSFKVMNAEYDDHLLLYSVNQGCGPDKTQQSLTENKILKWRVFDLSFFNNYMDVLTSNPVLMQAYDADLTRIDAMKTGRDTVYARSCTLVLGHFFFGHGIFSSGVSFFITKKCQRVSLSLY